LVTVPDFQQSFANGVGICFSHGMYQLGICGYLAVICLSDVAEIKMTSLQVVRNKISHNVSVLFVAPLVCNLI